MKLSHLLFRAVALVGLALPITAAQDVPVPQSCTPDVNSKLGQLLSAGQQGTVDNVMVCGTTTRRSTFQPGHGPAGSHHVFSLLVAFPDGGKKLIEVVSNDSLDGIVTAPASAQVFAYGQAFFDNNQFAAGIHDVHCSTHQGADNGWIVVNGAKHPASCPAP